MFYFTLPLHIAASSVYNVFDISLQCGPRDTVRDPEAGNKGLYTSLLERLHTIYVHEGKSLCDCTASLSTNYRCDAGKIYTH